MKKMELRMACAELRSNDDGSMLKVSGYVNKTNQLSEMLGSSKRFREKISPGVFRNAISKAKEVRFLAEHDPKMMLSSTKNGSLSLREDEKGLYMEAQISPTTYGRDYHQLISDGLITNMSFGFRTNSDSWDKQADGTYIRTIHSMDLFEVSAVRDPAYSQSSIAARSIEIVEDPEIRNVREEHEKLRLRLNSLIPEERKQEDPKMIEELRKEIEELRAFVPGNSTLSPDSNSVLSNEVIDINERLEAVSTAYLLAKKVYFDGGTLKLPYETALDNAQFVTENGSAPIINLNLAGFADLSGNKRLAVSVAITKLALEAAFDGMNDYIENLLIERIGTALQANVLAGDGVLGFRGIATDSNVSSSPITASNVTIQQLKDLMKKIHSAAIPGAAWFMNRAFFDRVADLKDANGEYYVKYEEGIPYLFGHLIEISDALANDSISGNIPVIFADISMSYTIGIKKDLEIKEITDDAQYVLAGNYGLVADMLCDGAITNYQSVAVGKVS